MIAEGAWRSQVELNWIRLLLEEKLLGDDYNYDTIWLRYDHSMIHVMAVSLPAVAVALRPKYRLSGYVIVTSMTFDK